MLTRESDYGRFVAAGVDETVKRAALRKLFSDPHFNVMDGLDIYIDDYGKPDPLPASMLRRMNQSKVLRLFEDDDPDDGVDGATDTVTASVTTSVTDTATDERGDTGVDEQVDGATDRAPAGPLPLASAPGATTAAGPMDPAVDSGPSSNPPDPAISNDAPSVANPLESRA